MLDEIKSAIPSENPKRPTIVHDRGERNSVTGLQVWVLRDRAGEVRRSWFYYYRTKAGKQRRPKLGDFPALSLPKARERARALEHQVFAGQDPKGDWEGARAERTVADLWVEVEKGHYSAKRYLESGWAKEAARLWEKDIKPAFGALKLSAVGVAAVRRWHRAYREKPITGNRALAVLKQMFYWAEQEEWRAQGTNPAALVERHAERERERFATEDELQRLGVELEARAAATPREVAFIYLCLLSGSRPRAIERATWDQLATFERDGKTWGLLTISGKTTASTGRMEQVVLPPPAMAALDRLPRTAGDTITGLTVRTDSLRQVWESARAAAGAKDLWLYDTRRTFATQGMGAGENMDKIGPVLNHRTTQTTKRYARSIPTQKLDVAGRIADRMAELLAPIKE